MTVHLQQDISKHTTTATIAEEAAFELVVWKDQLKFSRIKKKIASQAIIFFI